MKLFKISFLAALFFAACISAFANTVPVRIETEGYPLSKDEVRQMTDMLDQMAGMDVRVFGIQPPSLIHVHILGPYKRFRKYQKEHSNNQDKRVGFYSIKTKEVVVAGQPKRARTIGIAMHECHHAILLAHTKRCPLWMNEGLSQYFEYRDSTQSAKFIINPYLKDNARLKEHLKAGTLPLLKKILDMNDKDWLQWNRDDKHMGYATGWGLVYYLMSTSRGQALLRTLIHARQTRDYKKPSFLVNRYYPGGVAALQADWGQWIPQTRIPQILLVS